MVEVAELLTQFVSRLNLSEEMEQKLIEGGKVVTIRRGECVKQGVPIIAPMDRNDSSEHF